MTLESFWREFPERLVSYTLRVIWWGLFALGVVGLFFLIFMFRH